MLSHAKGNTLTRRNTKLMVEIIIGIIGMLGIMLSQIETGYTTTGYTATDYTTEAQVELETNSKMINQSTTNKISKIDWMDIIF